MAGESQSGQSSWALTGLAPGAQVAGYRVESRIGAGGMAMVLRARDEALGRTVALKILAPALAADQEFRERFVREARAVAAVDHPHIIPVYAAGQASGVLYLAMRFVVGGDLRSVVQREGPLPGERAVALLSPIAAALDAAHAAGLVHRDVKPANILVDASPGRPEHPYLSDFGLAKGSAASTGLTGTGQFLGTPDYAAPEQISGKPARAQTDQYALACVVYTVLTGSLLFARDESMAVLWAHMYDQPPALTDSRPDLPAAAGHVLARALSKAPDDRYATCAEFIDALRASLASPPRAVRGGRSAGFRPPVTEAAAGQPRTDRGIQAPPWSTQTWAPAAKRTGTPGPGRAGRGDRLAPGPLRGKRPLAAAATLAVVIIGVAAYLLVPSPKPPAGNPNAHGSLPASASSPRTGSTSTSTSSPPPTQAACAKLGVYCHIETRADDPVPFTTAELFPPAFTAQADGTSYTLAAAKADTTCANAVIGPGLIQALKSGGCTQVLRASYVSGNGVMMGTIGVVNLATTAQANAAGKADGVNSFIAPLPAAKGVASRLGRGTGVVESEYKGHYLILTWSEFVDGTTPSTKAQDTSLERFSDALVAGTANIGLSQRMVAG